MPTLTCPHCQTPQSISDEIFQRNLGKKCRCRQCQQIFVIESTPPAQESGGDFDWLNDDPPASPASAPPPPVAPQTKAHTQGTSVKAATTKATTVKTPAGKAPTVPAASPPPVAASDSQSADPDFASLLGGTTAPYSTEFPDLSQDETTVVVPPQPVLSSPDVAFPEISFDETLPETPPLAVMPFDVPQGDSTEPEVRSSVPTRKKPSTASASGEMTVNTVLLSLLVKIMRGIGWGTLCLLGIRLLAGLWGATKHPSTDAKVVGILGELVTAAVSIGGVVIWFLLAELVPLFVSMETRLRELSIRKDPPPP